MVWMEIQDSRDSRERVHGMTTTDEPYYSEKGFQIANLYVEDEDRDIVIYLAQPNIPGLAVQILVLGP